MDLQGLATIAQLIAAVAVVAVAGVGLVHMRESRRQRRDAAAVELMRSLQDPDFTRAFRLVYTLPAGITAKELRARGREYEEAAQLVGGHFETIGVLAHRGVIAFDVLEDLAGGVTTVLWSRLRDWVEAMRAEQSQDMYLEWFQWLDYQFKVRARANRPPAYHLHRRWRHR